MPRLTVHQLAKEEVYRDIIRVNQEHRSDPEGKPIKEGSVCAVTVDGKKRSYAVLRGYEASDLREVRMDYITRENLGVNYDTEYEFQFRPASAWGELSWAWNTSEIGYRIAARLAVVGFVLGVIAFVPILIDLVLWVLRTAFHHK